MYQTWRKLDQEQKVTSKNKLGGGKHPLPVLIVLIAIDLQTDQKEISEPQPKMLEM